LDADHPRQRVKIARRFTIDAIEALRSTLGSPVPAFLISGDTGPERLREASASGHVLLHKPVAPMALRATLNRLLKTDGTSRGVTGMP
jgi:CheY-like chemotaxis protein